MNDRFEPNSGPPPRQAAPAEESGKAGNGAAPGAVRRRSNEGGMGLKPSGRVASSAQDALAAAREPQTIADAVFICRDVNVFYGAKHALKNVDLDVARRSRCWR